MTNPMPTGRNAGEVRALRRQAAQLRKRAEGLQADLDLTVNVFAKAFEQQDHQESISDRIARTARSKRAQGISGPRA